MATKPTREELTAIKDAFDALDAALDPPEQSHDDWVEKELAKARTYAAQGRRYAGLEPQSA